MGFESIAHGAEGRMGSWLQGHKGNIKVFNHEKGSEQMNGKSTEN